MKLTKEQVERLSSLVMEGLKKKGLVVFKAEEAVVLEKIKGVILEDLSAEDRLDKEVEEILRARSSDLDSTRVDYRKMFNLVKHKLARERGIIL
jgi:hypothetical protein